MRGKGILRLLAATAVVVIADQGSKRIADDLLALHDTVRLMPGLAFAHTQNEGVAFGMFAGRPLLVFSLVAVSLAGLLAFYWFHADRPYAWLATGLLLGGALGNLIDRAALGYVRDFIDPARWPAFNLADVAITFGVIGLFLLPDRKEDRDA